MMLGLKLKTPVLALVLAVSAFAVSVAVLCVCEEVGRFVALFYYPAVMLAMLCAPDPYGEGGPLLYLLCLVVYGLLQWYLIFVIPIGVHRHFSRRLP